MYATQCVPQGGDKLRLQNFGVSRFNELKAICNRQRECTKLAIDGKKIRSPMRFTDLLLEAILGKPIDTFINERAEQLLEQRRKNEEGTNDKPTQG